jgi:Kef-type K+ transport system membrane component KefB
MQSLSEQNILIFLVQLFFLLGLARILGELFRLWKQPVITAEILVGVLLGPTIFGRFLPALHSSLFPPDAIQNYMLETVAWLGLLFFLLEAGLKMDFSTAWRHRGKALAIALTDIIVPMAIAFSLCYFLPEKYLVNPNQRFLFSLFMATAMTISAMPITIRTLSDLNMAKTDLGFLIMSALSVNEIIGWLIFALVLGMFMQANELLARTLTVFSFVIAFTVFCLTLGRKFANTVISKIKEHNLPEPGSSLTFICLLGLLCGAIFQKMGVHALLGFFIAGVIVGEAKALPERTRQVISQMVYAILVPIFFVRVGLGIDFFKSFDIFLVFFVTIVGIFGKFLGAWLGVNFTRLAKVNRLPVAIAHTPGGSMEIVVGILALKYHLISEPMFEAIVFGAIISSVILGPWLKNSLCSRKEISVLEFFSRREIIPELRAANRDNVIIELCELAHAQSTMPSLENLSAAVLARENSMGTAIEEGIAIPHARIPSLIRPVIVFGRSKSGIDWNSPDGKLSHFIFLILTPKENDDMQVQILRIIVRTMSELRTQDSLMQASDQQAIWEVLRESFTKHQVIRSRKK